MRRHFWNNFCSELFIIGQLIITNTLQKGIGLFRTFFQFPLLISTQNPSYYCNTQRTQTPNWSYYRSSNSWVTLNIESSLRSLEGAVIYLIYALQLILIATPLSNQWVSSMNYELNRPELCNKLMNFIKLRQRASIESVCFNYHYIYATCLSIWWVPRKTTRLISTPNIAGVNFNYCFRVTRKLAVIINWSIYTFRFPFAASNNLLCTL